MYFTYNLPTRAPSYLHPTLVRTFEQTMKRITDRMERLEKALEVRLDDCTLPMTEAQFAATAKKVFDASPEQFDKMGWQEIALAVRLLFDGQPVRPRLEFPNAITIVDASFITTKEWELLRHIGLGGSDSAVAKGASPYTTPLELYHNKCGTPLKIPDTSPKPYFDRGHILEPRVISAFCKVTGATLIPENRMFLSKTHPHCLADVDGIIETKAGELYVFEAKSTVEDNKKPWFADRIPAHYVPQCQHYLAVLNDPRLKGTYISCLFVRDYESAGIYLGSEYDEGDLVVQLVERNEETEQNILDNSEWFYNKYLDAEVEPPMNFTHKKRSGSGVSTIIKDVDLLRRLTGTADPALPPKEFSAKQFRAQADEYLKMYEKYTEAKKQAAALEVQVKALQVPFIEALGRTVSGTIPMEEDNDHIICVSYSPRSKTKVDTDKLKTYFPEAYDECATENPECYREFSLKIKSKNSKKKKGGK